MNDEQKRPLLIRVMTAKLTLEIAAWVLFAVLAWFLLGSLQHFIEGDPPQPIEWSEFKSAEQLNDFMSRESGTRVRQGTDWWSVEVTRPVRGFGDDSVPCTRVLRTVADGKTILIAGDWRYNSDGFRVCRYPGDGR